MAVGKREPRFNQAGPGSGRAIPDIQQSIGLAGPRTILGRGIYGVGRPIVRQFGRFPLVRSIQGAEHPVVGEIRPSGTGHGFALDTLKPLVKLAKRLRLEQEPECGQVAWDVEGRGEVISLLEDLDEDPLSSSHGYVIGNPEASGDAIAREDHAQRADVARA
jgi:hypothetical protein